MSISQSKYSKHNFFMNLALMQAKRALGNTGENPAVGCVIVKNSCVIGAGFTGKKGRPHAEVNAINSSKFNIDNSCLYVTLEPCSHYGKTSPCTKTIKRNKIKKVFFSIKDPDKRSHNKSLKYFKKNKIAVKIGINHVKIKNFYKSYFNFKKDSLPFVTAKLAISKDFYTNCKKGKWITNKFSRYRGQLIRRSHDCIITSARTVIKDNPKLTCRINGLDHISPTRIILDKKLKISIKSEVVKTAKLYRTIIFFNSPNKKIINQLKKYKIKFIKFPLGSDGNFDLRNILAKIKQLGFSRIMLESGLNLTTNFLKENLVNDFQLFISNMHLGKNGTNNFKRYIESFLSKKKHYLEKVNLFGDKLVFYRIK